MINLHVLAAELEYPYPDWIKWTALYFYLETGFAEMVWVPGDAVGTRYMYESEMIWDVEKDMMSGHTGYARVCSTEGKTLDDFEPRMVKVRKER